MSTLFGFIFFFSFLASIGIAIYWFIARLKHKPFPMFKKAIIGSLVILTVSLMGGVATANNATKDSKPTSSASKKSESSKKSASESSEKASIANSKAISSSEAAASSKAKQASIESSEKASSESSVKASLDAAEKSSQETVRVSQAASISEAQSLSNSEKASNDNAVATTASQNNTTDTTDTTQVYTGTSQQIIGNAKSHIYHVPGQAGYHMNSANAIYFGSEAEAQANGYRRAQR